MRRRCWCGAMLVLAAVGACSATDAGQEAGGALERWSLQKVATIDPDAAGMGEAIRSLTADGDGNVYLAGYGAGGIYVFDGAGEPLRVLGRAGSGPGEFKDRYSLAWVGDTLAVFDPGNGRIEYVDRLGNWVASQGNPRITGGSDIRFHQAGPREFFRPSWGRDASTDGIRQFFIRTGFGAHPDTLVVPDVDLGTKSSVTCRDDGSISWWESPNAPEARSAVSPEGYLVTWRTDQYYLTFTRNDSQVVRVISNDQKPVPLTDSMWAADVADYEKFRKQMSGAECDAGSPARPETVWLLNAVEFDDQGRAWVEGMQRDSVMLAVYDTAGKEIAAMPAPKRDLDVPYVIRGDRLYEVEADQDGLQQVVIYHVLKDGSVD